jgi:hypothetical protein
MILVWTDHPCLRVERHINPNSSGWHGIMWQINQKFAPTLSVILSLDESKSPATNIWYQRRSILQPKHLLLIPFPRLPRSLAGSRNIGCPYSSLLSCTDEQQLLWGSILPTQQPSLVRHVRMTVSTHGCLDCAALIGGRGCLVNK